MFLCKRSLINQLCHRTFGYLLRILLCFLLCLFAACGRTSSDSKAIDKNKRVAEEVVDFDLDKIMARGLLKVIIENSSTSYFIYKGQWINWS